MRVIKFSKDNKDVFLSIAKEDITVMLVNAGFWLNSIEHDGLVPAKLVRIVRQMESDPDIYINDEETPFSLEVAEFLMFLNNACIMIKIIPEREKS
jgi:hypothetical protein